MLVSMTIREVTATTGVRTPTQTPQFRLRTTPIETLTFGTTQDPW